MKVEPHENINNNKQKTELSVQKKQQIEKEFIGIIIPYKNHTVWEINNETLEVKKAEFIKKPFMLYQTSDNKEILQRKGFSYVSALSKKTALKKFKEGKNGSKEVIENKYVL